ncbi:MAG: phosphatidate cytidylyltransferase, partial [Candidatus Margulisbacteria bacterium]|nr:phosphatidate cytidylyltransferase [Candidatus Margulisiibacteriota bacterium]
MRSFNPAKLLQRSLTIAVYGPVVLLALYFGELAFFIAVLLTVFVSLQEMYNMYNIRFKKNHDSFYYGYLFSTLLLLAVYMQETSYAWENYLFLVLSTLIICFLIYELGKKKIYFLSSPLCYLIRSILYIGLMYVHIILLRARPQGLEYCLYICAVVWANDVFAFLIGIPFGRRRLAPEISPQKSIEGAAGGLLGAALFSVLAAMFFGFAFSLRQAVILGLAISIFAQLGDLIESLLKRALLAKDFGKLL